MPKISTFTSAVVPLVRNDIDTDQIIPARFLKVTDKVGLGSNLFSDWRYNADGTPKSDFILNQPAMQGRNILLAGDNFGCGSSREHAPWALVGWGIRAVLALDFGDIFRNNALKNGLLPITLPKDVHQKLVAQVEANPDLKLTIDLPNEAVLLPDGGSVKFPINAFSKTCLLNDIDELGYLLRFDSAISQFEKQHVGA